MKKLFCLILALLLLAGCSVQPQPMQTEPSDTQAPATEPEPPKPGLYELHCYTAEGGYRPLTVAARGDEAAVVLCQTPADPEHYVRYVQYLDLQTGKASQIIPLERSEEFDDYCLSVEPDGSLVAYDPYADTASHYNRYGKLLDRIDNPYPAPEDFRFAHDLTNDWFTFQTGYASYHAYCGGDYLFSAYAFADEPEALYLIDGGFDAVRDASGRRILESDYLRNNAGLCYRILDLDSGRELDRVTIENDAPEGRRDDTFLSEATTVFCDEGVLLRVQKSVYEPGVEYGEDGPEPAWEDRIYLWRPDETAASPVKVTRVTTEELCKENAGIAARIRSKYEINVLLDTAPEGDTPPIMDGDDPEELADASLVTSIEPLPTYELLMQLEHFLHLLPEGFTHEMQTDFPEPANEYGMTGFDGFDIYVIKQIPGSSAAYANGWGERLKIVFATDEFSASTVPHEFMHLIERRLSAYYESVGESFWDAWEALNPEDFNYFDEHDYDLVYDYFVSSYAMTDSMEDRAETFMEVFISQDPLEECYWYQNAPHIQAKVACLQEAIRRSYPSVQAVESAYWESK